MPGRPLCGEIVTLTILPPAPLGIIAFVATAWVISQVPSTLSRITVRKPFGVMSSAGVRNWPPALLTSRSILPWRASTASTSASTWSSSRMSQTVRAGAARGAELDGLVERLRAAAADDDLRAERSQLDRAAAAEPGAAAADERDLAGEQVGLEDLGGHRGAA